MKNPEVTLPPNGPANKDEKGASSLAVTNRRVPDREVVAGPEGGGIPAQCRAQTGAVAPARNLTPNETGEGALEEEVNEPCGGGIRGEREAGCPALHRDGG